MRRKRFQKGSVRPRRQGRNKVWLAQWREEGIKRSKVLGLCSEIPKAQAETMLASILQPINAQICSQRAPSQRFGEYVEKVFLPLFRQKWKESTRGTSEADIMRYLVSAFEAKPLQAITRSIMQSFLDNKALQLSSSVVGHLRWHFNAIFRMAKSDGLVEFNPAEALYASEGTNSGEKRHMSAEQVKLAIQALDLEGRLIFRMAVFDGMRPGELFAIRLGRIGTNHVLIDQRVYAGKFDSPKGRKGKNTARTVALSPGTIEDIAIWRKYLTNQDEDSFLFPSETGVTPLRPNNYWKRQIRPRLTPLGLKWVNFQVLRRTNASLSRKARVDDKVAADQRGHGLGVSLEVYAASDLEQKVEAVTKLEAAVNGVAQVPINQLVTGAIS